MSSSPGRQACTKARLGQSNGLPGMLNPEKQNREIWCELIQLVRYGQTPRSPTEGVARG